MSIISKLIDFCDFEKRNQKNNNNQHYTVTKNDCEPNLKNNINNTAPNLMSTDTNIVNHSTEFEPSKKTPYFRYKNSEYIEYEGIYLYDTEEEQEDSNKPYVSTRFSIKGLDLFFIDIAREIVKSNNIAAVLLMREYNIDSARFNQILNDMQTAQIIDEDLNILMTPEELEKFIDIYEPNLFECTHGVFDKEIFMCIGEIIYDKGIEDTYSCLEPDEVVDYLKIMEKLNILTYDSSNNIFKLLVNKTSFIDICNHIPNTFARTNYIYENNDAYINSNYNTMTGPEFEKFCSFLLSKNGYENIKITPTTGDHGIDIFAEKEDITYAIQCKCYSTNVGNSAIQQAYTGKCLYKKDVAVVLTNQFFTQQAIDEAKELGIKLWDKTKLDSFIANANL